MDTLRKIKTARDDMPAPYEGNEHLYHNRAEYAVCFQTWASFNDAAIRAAMENVKNLTYKERVLEDEYPIYPGYLYIVNGKVTAAPFNPLTPTVAAWKIAPLRLKTAETPSPLLKTEGAGEGKDEGAKTKKEKPLDLAERGAVKKTGDKKKPAAKKGKKS